MNSSVPLINEKKWFFEAGRSQHLADDVALFKSFTIVLTMKEWRETEGLSVAHGCGRIQETKPGLSWIGQRKQRFGSLPTFLLTRAIAVELALNSLSLFCDGMPKATKKQGKAAVEKQNLLFLAGTTCHHCWS